MLKMRIGGVILKNNGLVLARIAEKLHKKIGTMNSKDYVVPDLWNCFGYSQGSCDRKVGLLSVNPYSFYYECINSYLLPRCKAGKEYSKSLSVSKQQEQLNDSMGSDATTILAQEQVGYVGGDWIKRSSIYSMHIRTCTSWDHNRNGELDCINEHGFKETGTFLKSLALLPLLKKMGIDTIYLLPISKYSRRNKKGELGSPYAVKNFFELDPDLKDPMTGAEFTVEDEFTAFVEACHILEIKVLIDIIPRTASRDNDLLVQHPDWFYWVKTDCLEHYKPPYVHGVEEAEKPSFANLKQIYASKQVYEHISRFTHSPDRLDALLWEKISSDFMQDPTIDLLSQIELFYGITTAPAFADCINDPQPTWDDVTYLKLYHDIPTASKEHLKGEDVPPYILFDTIKSDVFKGEKPNLELWNILSGVIPSYQQRFGIDGARIDMGHALPSELVKQLLEEPRKLDKDFAFIAEELLVSGAEKAIATGYNMIIGYGWWLEPRIFEHKTHEFMYGCRNYKAPVFACAETPDTPRIAARDGGRILSKLVTIMNQFLPNAVPFLNSGLEIYETQPMNTGLDARFDERYRLHPEDEFYGKLGFFDRYALHWTNPLRWDLPDTLEAVAKIRNTYLDTITSPECYVPIDFANERIPAIGLAYVIKNRRWKSSDNLLIIVCNTDIYNEQQHVLYLDQVREQSGNSSKKAWLAFSANEWSHDIYDFDEAYNLKLHFKPGEVKILLM